MTECFIYKSLKKSETYLYILEKSKFEILPDSMLAILGDLEFVMSLDLEKTMKLANADIDKVKFQLAEKAYYLQLPPKIHVS